MQSPRDFWTKVKNCSIVAIYYRNDIVLVLIILVENLLG